MPEACSFKIGGLSVALIPDRLDGHYDTPEKFDRFRTQGPADINLTIHSDQVSEFPVDEMIFDSGQTWCQYLSQGQCVLWVKSSQQDPRMVGIFSQDFHSGKIFVGTSDSDASRLTFPLGYPLGELYMTNLLGNGLGVMLHSCGVIYRGSGLVFAGLSGSGKTTTGRLWQQQDGARVVNDDRVIVRKTDGQFRLYGTPWHGEGGMTLAEDAPLQRIFILKHAYANQIRPLLSAQAVSALLARSFSPFWSTDGMKFSLQFLAEMCREVPCFELGFLPNQTAVDFVSAL